MDLDKNELRSLILSNSTKISAHPILSQSAYTKTFEVIHIDSLDSGFVRCKICMRLLSFKSDRWTTIIRHYKQHHKYHNVIQDKRDCTKIIPLHHSFRRLKKFMKNGRRPKIRKLLQKRNGSSGTEYLIRWKQQKPDKICWITRSLFKRL